MDRGDTRQMDLFLREIRPQDQTPFLETPRAYYRVTITDRDGGRWSHILSTPHLAGENGLCDQAEREGWLLTVEPL